MPAYFRAESSSILFSEHWIPDSGEQHTGPRILSTGSAAQLAPVYGSVVHSLKSTRYRYQLAPCSTGLSFQSVTLFISPSGILANSTNNNSQVAAFRFVESMKEAPALFLNRAVTPRPGGCLLPGSPVTRRIAHWCYTRTSEHPNSQICIARQTNRRIQLIACTTTNSLKRHFASSMRWQIDVYMQRGRHAGGGLSEWVQQRLSTEKPYKASTQPC